MDVNPRQLHEELEAAGLAIAGVDATGAIAWPAPPTPEQEALAATVIKAHVAQDDSIARKEAGEALAQFDFAARRAAIEDARDLPALRVEMLALLDLQERVSTVFGIHGGRQRALGQARGMLSNLVQRVMGSDE